MYIYWASNLNPNSKFWVSKNVPIDKVDGGLVLNTFRVGSLIVYGVEASYIEVAPCKLLSAPCNFKTVYRFLIGFKFNSISTGEFFKQHNGNDEPILSEK